MSREQDLVNIARQTLGLVGVEPFKGRAGYYVAAFVSILRAFYFYLILKMVIENYTDINVIMDAAEGFSSYMQGGTKLVVILFHRSDLKWLITNVDNFWKDLPNSKPDGYKFWFKAFPNYNRTFYVTLALLYIRSIVTKSLVFPCKVPDFPHAFKVLLAGQYFAFACDCVYVVGIDIFYMGMCVIIKRQFVLIRDGMRLMDKEEDELAVKAIFKKCIVHHDFMLQFTDCFIKTFDSALLLQYLLSTYSICIQLFILTERSTIEAFLTSCFYMICVSFQLALYCFPADDISEIALQVSNFIYETDWYRHPLAIQRSIPLVICRSQQTFTFTAGGMIFINKAAFTNVFKSGLSFYTAVKSFKSED